MSQSNYHSGRYDHVRCPVCARPWLGYTESGVTEPPHPEGEVCSKYRPIERPEWLDKAVAASEAGAPLRVLHGALQAAIIAKANDVANGDRPGSGVINGELKS